MTLEDASSGFTVRKLVQGYGTKWPDQEHRPVIYLTVSQFCHCSTVWQEQLSSQFSLSVLVGGDIPHAAVPASSADNLIDFLCPES